jgi:hypothetical protein
MFHIIFLIALILLVYQCLRLTWLLISKKDILAQTGLDNFSLYNFLVAIWLTPLPIFCIGAPLFGLEFYLRPFFGSLPNAFLLYLPVIFAGKSFSRRLGRKTDIVYELNRKIVDKVFSIVFLGILYIILMLVIGLAGTIL